VDFLAETSTPLLTIGGEPMPTPSEMNISYMDLSKAERNANGLMIIERITTKRKLEIKYTYLNSADLSKLLNAVSPTFYNVTFLDVKTGTYQTASMYCGDRSVGWLDYIDDIPRYKDLSFDLIER
jgi:hypothetical protein